MLCAEFKYDWSFTLYAFGIPEIKCILYCVLKIIIPMFEAVVSYYKQYLNKLVKMVL